MQAKQISSVNPEQVKLIGDLILRNEVIPIVGYELLWVKERDEFIKHLIDNIDQGFVDGSSLFEDFRGKFPHAPTTELINYIYHSLDVRDKRKFNFEFSKAITKVRAEIPIMWEPLIQLAKIEHFKLYINVTCMNVIEIAVNSFRATKPSEYEVYGPLKPERRDLPDPKNNFFHNPYAIPNIDKPSIYNLFGTYNTDSKYLLTDIEYTDMLVELLQKESFCPNLKRYLSQASLLFIGCNFSDWFLRFFTRFWAGPAMDVRLAEQYNILLDSLSQSGLMERSFYVSNYNIMTLSGNTTDFLDSLYQYLYPDARPTNHLESNPLDNHFKAKYNNYVLISYNSLDREIARYMKNVLNQNNIKVWMDEEQIDVGDDLELKITNAVHRSCTVIQIISNKISERSDDNPYFLREWELILNQKNSRIPVFVDNVNDSLLVPPNLNRYREVIRKTMDRNIYGLVINRDKPEIRSEDVSTIRDIQYKSYVKDLKFK